MQRNDGKFAQTTWCASFTTIHSPAASSRASTSFWKEWPPLIGCSGGAGGVVILSASNSGDQPWDSTEESGLSFAWAFGIERDISVCEPITTCSEEDACLINTVYATLTEQTEITEILTKETVLKWSNVMYENVWGDSSVWSSGWS